MSLGSAAVFRFTRACSGSRRVHLGLLGSLAGALGVVGWIRSRWVHSSALCGLLDSSGVVGFTRVCPRGRRFIWGRMSWGSIGLSRVVGFLRACPGCHPGSLCLLARALGFTCVRSFGVVGFTRVHCSCLWGHPGWLSLLSRGLGVVELIRGLSVHSCAPWVSLGSYGVIVARRVVVGTIRGGWVHSHALWGSLGSSWVVGFTLARSGGRWVLWHNYNVRVFTECIYI